MSNERQSDGGVAVADCAFSCFAVDFAPAYRFFQRAAAQSAPLLRIRRYLNRVFVRVIILLQALAQVTFSSRHALIVCLRRNGNRDQLRQVFGHSTTNVYYADVFRFRAYAYELVKFLD